MKIHEEKTEGISDKEFLSAREVCQLLGICRTSLYKNFPIPKIKIGKGKQGRVIYRRKDIEAYLDSKKG